MIIEEQYGVNILIPKKPEPIAYTEPGTAVGIPRDKPPNTETNPAEPAVTPPNMPVARRDSAVITSA